MRLTPRPDRDLQELEEGARKALCRSEELIQQTKKLVKQSRDLMSGVQFKAHSSRPSDN